MILTLLIIVLWSIHFACTPGANQELKQWVLILKSKGGSE